MESEETEMFEADELWLDSGSNGLLLLMILRD